MWLCLCTPVCLCVFVFPYKFLLAQSEHELRVAQTEFDRQAEVTRLLLEGISSTHVSQVPSKQTSSAPVDDSFSSGKILLWKPIGSRQVVKLGPSQIFLTLSSLELAPYLKTLCQRQYCIYFKMSFDEAYIDVSIIHSSTSPDTFVFVGLSGEPLALSA